MRGLVALAVGLGVLIVIGIGVIAFTIINRIASVGADRVTSVTLEEPPGSRIASQSLGGDRVSLQLEGGGPDRLVIIDLRNGKVLGRVTLR